jgi:hypothetical protein
MNGKENDGLNGVNTQMHFQDSMQNQPEMSKATFSVKSE